METSLLTNFGGLNTNSPEMELSTTPVESPNIVNAVMEEGTIFCRPPQKIYFSFENQNNAVSAFYIGRIQNKMIEIVQVGNVLQWRKKTYATWWSNQS